MLATPRDELDEDVKARAGTVAEKQDVLEGRQKVEYDHACVYCVAKEMNITVEEAAKTIKRPRMGRTMERARKFHLALYKVQQTWEFLKIGGDDSENSPPMGGGWQVIKAAAAIQSVEEYRGDQ